MFDIIKHAYTVSTVYARRAPETIYVRAQSHNSYGLGPKSWSRPLVQITVYLFFHGVFVLFDLRRTFGWPDLVVHEGHELYYDLLCSHAFETNP